MKLIRGTDLFNAFAGMATLKRHLDDIPGKVAGVLCPHCGAPRPKLSQLGPDPPSYVCGASQTHRSECCHYIEKLKAQVGGFPESDDAPDGDDGVPDPEPMGHEKSWL